MADKEARGPVGYMSERKKVQGRKIESERQLKSSFFELSYKYFGF